MDPLPPAPGEIEPNGAAAVRGAFARAGFDESVMQFIGAVGVPGWRNTAREALRGSHDAARAALVKFFVIRDEVPEETLIGALGGATGLDALAHAGLALRRGEGAWRCPFNLALLRGVLAFGDAIDDPATLAVADDYVLTVGSSTAIVDDLAVREPCALAVDLGCGQGFLAVRSLTHARRCIATDINPRALAFTRANASLAGVGDRIETRLGSLLEPLSDAAGQVDLFTCNPPFIFHPGTRVTATSAPNAGDAMLEHIVRRAPGTLREGGWAIVLGIWEHAEPADWLSRVRGWFAESRCDALVLRFESYRAEDYLRAWLQPENYAAAEPAWRMLCEQRRISAVTFGAIVLRRRNGPTWFRALRTLIDHRTGSASEQLRAYFRSQTLLQSMGSPLALLDRRLRVAPGRRFDPTGPPLPAPSGSAAGLVLPLQQLSEYEPLLSAFETATSARLVLTRFHRSGMSPPPDHPAVASTLQGLITNGYLDIVE